MPRPNDFSGRSDIQHYDKARADREKMYNQKLTDLTHKYTRLKQDIQKLRGQAVGDSAKLLELDELEKKYDDKYAQDKANLYTEYYPSDNRSVNKLVNEQKRQEAASEVSTQGNSEKQQTASADDKDTSSESDNTMSGIFDSLGNYFRSMNKSDAPGASNLRNQAKMHDTQAGEEQANAQQSQQIANRDYRGEAEKNAVASAATQNAQTVANLGNVSAGAAALERTVGTPDYNTHMNRQDTQREKAVEKQREAWGARQTAEEERQAAEAENNDKSNMDMYNSLARYLSMGAGGNNTDTTEQGATSIGSTPESTNPSATGEGNNTEVEEPVKVVQKEPVEQGEVKPDNNLVPPVANINGIKPDETSVDAVTNAAGTQPLQNQVVTQSIHEAAVRNEAYKREGEFWDEYTEQVPKGGDNSRKQTYERFVAFQENNPDEVNKSIAEQVSDFIKQDSDSYQNVDIDEILGANKGKYPPWLVAKAASIRNNAENGGDRQNADALSEQFSQLYYTYTNKNSWYNKLSSQEQKRCNELYAKASPQQQEAFLSASTDEQQKIYQSWLDGSEASASQPGTADYSTHDTWDDIYNSSTDDEKRAMNILRAKNPAAADRYERIMSNNYAYYTDGLAQARADLSAITGDKDVMGLIGNFPNFKKQLHAVDDDIKSMDEHKMTAREYKAALARQSAKESDDAYKQFIERMPPDIAGMDYDSLYKAGINLDNLSKADFIKMFENTEPLEGETDYDKMLRILKAFPRVKLTENGPTSQWLNTLDGHPTSSDERMKNIIAGCWSRF